MKKIKLVLILSIITLSIQVSFAQTTYTSNPTSGTYVACPSGTATSCGGVPVQVAVAQMRVSSISGNQVTFQMKRCNNSTFSASGTFYIKTGGECGTVVGSQTYAAGASTASVTVTMSHTSGSITYTGTLTSSTTDRYDAGDVTITATTIAPTITVTQPNTSGLTYYLGAAMNITWSYTGLSSSDNISIQMVNCGNNTVVTTIIDPTNNDGTHSWTIPTNTTPGQYRIKVYATSQTSVVDYSDNCFTIASPTISVTQPNATGLNYTAGTNMNITWSSAGLNSSANVSIQLVNCNNNTVVTTIIDPTNNDGTHSWTIPTNITPGQYRIKIYATGQTSVVDYSDNCFTIASPTISVTQPNSTGLTYYLGAAMNITWSYTGLSSSDNISIQMVNCGNNTVVTTIIDPTNNDGTHSWTIPTNTTPGQYRIKVYATSQTSVVDYSDNCFTIASPTISVTQPNATGLNYTAGTNMNITWSSAGLNSSANVSIQLVNCNNNTVVTTIIDPTNNDGTHSWTIPTNITPGQYRIKIYATGQTSVVDYSDNCFTIASPTISVTQPNSTGLTYYLGAAMNITWSYTGLSSSDNISIQMVNCGNNTVVTTIIDPTNNDGTHSWTIPTNTTPGQYRIKVYATSQTSVVDYSDNCFTIASPTISVTQPNATGLNYTAGTNMNITWSSAGLNSSANVSIQLVNCNNNTVVTTIIDPTNNDGTHSWTIPTNITPGQYRIKIYATNQTTVVDYSDNCFTITSCLGIINPPTGEPLTATCYLMAQNIIDGSQNGTYNTSTPLKKQHLAKICFKGLFGGNIASSVADYFPNPFYDLQNLTDTFHNYVLAMSYLEYTNGIAVFDRDRVYFNPDSSIQRKYALKALMETFNILPQPSSVFPNPFTDVNVSDPFYTYIKRAYELNITTQTAFRPTDNITREEAFVMLYRILTNPSITKPTPSPTSYSTFFVPGNYSPSTYNAPHTLQTGNFNHYVKSSFTIPGRNVSLDFSHSYNSYLTELPDELFPQSPIAKGWSHTYNSYIQYHLGPDHNSTADNRLIVVWADGTIHSYKYQNPSFVCETQGVYDNFTFVNASKIEIKTKAQVTYTFERISSTDFTFVLTKITDRNSNTVTINYQSAPNVTWYGNSYTAKRISNVQDPSGRSLNFSYNSNNQLQSISDPLGRIIQFTYSNGQLSRFTDAKGQHTDYTYSILVTETDLLTRIKLPKGNQIDNTYYQRKLASTKYNNSTTTVAMTPNFGNSNSFYSSQVTDPQNVTTNSTFNSNGYMSGFTGNGSTLSSAYNIANQPTVPSQIAMDGITTTMQYDTKGNITQITRTGGSITQTETFTYDAMNNVTSHTDALNHTTTYSYNGTGNLTQITDALGNQTAITYNSSGQPTQTLNPSGVQTTYSYNSYGNLNQITLPSLGISSSTLYDAASRVLKTTNPNNQATEFTYDANDNLLTNKDALNYTTTFAYDANDNLTTITNAKGKATTLSYNNNDWVISESFEGALKQYSYNSDGTLNTYTSPKSTAFNYQYDAQGRLTNDGYATYTYNANNNLNTVTGNGYTITYGYDNLQRITSVQTAYPLGFSKTVAYQYDITNRITRITNPGGFYTDYVYDNANRLTEVRWNGASSPPTAKYFYRNDGLTSYVELGNGTKTYYAYDAAGRMTKLVNIKAVGDTISAYEFTLDPNGNHLIETAKEQYTSYPTMSAANINYTYNTDNSIATSTNNVFSFDNNGNCISRTGRTYTYDTKDNILTGSNSNSYTYDALENRRTKTTNGTTTGYVLDALNAANVLVETDASGSPQWYYVYGQGLVARVNASNGNIYYYHYDYRGSTTAITDAGKNVTHKYQYDDFGNLLQQQEATPNPFKYVGKYGVMYEDSMLYYMRARYYDPTIGRFLSEDPIWSVNLYPYVENNPVCLFDPKGESAATAGALVGGVIAFGAAITLGIATAPVLIIIAGGTAVGVTAALVTDKYKRYVRPLEKQTGIYMKNIGNKYNPQTQKPLPK